MYNNDHVYVLRQAKMLEEMDAEFGIGNLIEEEFGAKKKSVVW